MNPLLIEKEISIGHEHGEGDVVIWIEAFGLDKAIDKADDRLLDLMAENSISDIKNMEKVPPYIIGLMRAYDEFLSRHCSVFKEGEGEQGTKETQTGKEITPS
jgi:hypothetical protein